MKLGSAQSKVRAAWRLVEAKVGRAGAAFAYRLDRKKLEQVRRREGRYLTHTNLTETLTARSALRNLTPCTLRLPPKLPPKTSAAQTVSATLL